MSDRTVNSSKVVQMLPGNTTEVSITKENGETAFCATQFGTGKDNPEDPNLLTDLMRSRSVSFTFANRDSFDITLSAQGPFGGGRNFQFAGDSSFRPVDLDSSFLNKNRRDNKEDEQDKDTVDHRRKIGLSVLFL